MRHYARQVVEGNWSEGQEDLEFSDYSCAAFFPVIRENTGNFSVLSTSESVR
jgi:hypothetical protein